MVFAGCNPTQPVNDPLTFYAASRNDLMTRSTVWRVSEHNDPERLYEFNDIQEVHAADLLSEREYNLFASAVEHSLFPYLDVFVYDAYIYKNIVGMWMIDDKHLLVNTIQYPSAPSLTNTFGYYELFSVNIENPEAPIIASLLKLDLHDELLDQWGCNPSVTGLYIKSISVSPAAQKAVVIVIPDDQYCNQSYSHLFLIDLEDPQEEIVEIPMADWPAWSPDGLQFAYYERSFCGDRECVVNIQRYDLAENKSTLVRIDEPLAEALYFSWLGLAITWLDNTTLFIQSLRPYGDGQTVYFVRYDLITGREIEFNQQDGLAILESYTNVVSTPFDFQLPDDETDIRIVISH
jgi:hypothetical protein